MRHLVLLPCTLNELSIQPIGLVLCNVYFLKIICSNDKFIKSIQFIFHQPFCTLDHRRSNQSTLIIRKWLDMFQLAFVYQKILQNPKRFSHDSSQEIVINGRVNNKFMMLPDSLHPDPKPKTSSNKLLSQCSLNLFFLF